jgi:hypothetical protein
MASQVSDAFAYQGPGQPDGLERHGLPAHRRRTRDFPKQVRPNAWPLQGRRRRVRPPSSTSTTSGWPTTTSCSPTGPGQGLRGRGHHLKVREGRVHRHRRALGLRQVTFMKLATGLKRPSRGTVDHRRAAGDRAAEDHRHGLPGAQRCCPGARRWTTCCCRWRSSSPTAPVQARARVRGQGPPLLAKRRAWPATRTSSPGSSPAACSSAPASAAR